MLLNQLCQILTPHCSAKNWYIGFSGGLDSSVLLHALVCLKERMELPPLTAVHIHHGLQAVSAHWPNQCQAYCQGLGVNFLSLSVQVSVSGQGIEAAAREARYGAWEQLLKEGDVLLTAQHANDQAETLLFRLLRGAGVKGLGAMSSERLLGAGQLVRPLLAVQRAELEGYAQQHGLVWIEDPSNQDVRYSRNYLRHEVIPHIQARWPQFVRQLGRTAAHMQEAQLLLEDCAQQDLSLCLREKPRLSWLNLPHLSLMALRSLSEVRQRNLLRFWLSAFVPLPDTAHWIGWEQLRDAAPEATPRWQLDGFSVQRGGEHVWLVPDAWSVTPVLGAADLNVGEWISLPQNGQVQLREGQSCADLRLSYRQGGESLLLQGRGHRDLKRLLNEAKIPPFIRHRLPLLWQGSALVAVANLPDLSQSGWKLDWVPSGLS